MNRETKFRGKRIDNDEWVYGSLIQLNSGLCYITKNIHGMHLPLDGKLICDFTYQVHPDTVGEYTGLPDKNGKEIYEGDMIRHHTSKGSFFNRVIKFNKGMFGFYDYVKSWNALGIRQGNKPDNQKYEVIGTIHDKEKANERD